METILNRRYFIITLFTLILLSACSSAPQTTTTPLPTSLDVNEITSLVMANVYSQLESQQPILPVVNRDSAIAAANEGIQASLINLYQRTNPAVVYIITPPVGSGSGYLYSREGHILTNNHVVSGANSIEVVFANGDRQRAKTIGSDSDSDLAVIKVEELPVGIEPLPLADPDSLQVGQFVAAIGNPFGEQGSMSLGIISGLGRSMQAQRDMTSGSTYTLPEVVQTDAPINPGNSGGPLLNLAGEVVGLNAAIASTSGSSSGVGFAIPARAIQLIVPHLIENGDYTYTYMGVGFDDEVSLDEQSSIGLSQTRGAYLIGVVPGGPADKAGLIPGDSGTRGGGDLIIAVDGHPVSNFSDLNSYLVFHTTVDQTIQLTVLRGGTTITIPLTLGARP
jgi:2-alkenal reductase